MLKRTLMTSLFLSLATIGFVGCGGEETAPPADTTIPADTATEDTALPGDSTEPALPE